MRLRSPSQLRVDPAQLDPVKAQFPELMAPLARAINHGKCAACGASVTGVLDTGPGGGPQVQITCFGDPAHVFIFDASSGRVPDQPTAMGTLKAD
ncbi:MAG: hypothetical protein M3010_07190 [Candidatus Dormibacteraeota bacterium]|nr:hypothetical protein [Candidatus Dormibacteraeota bacterium]